MRLVPEHPADDLVDLDQDHPGFRDAAYRARRNAIARIALDYRGGPVPAAEYSADEHAVWRHVQEVLRPQHHARACRAYLEATARLELPGERIPQLHQLNPRLRAATGFRMLPVAGLVTAKTFLGHLGSRIFLSTQYIRHASAPLYTPEPDVVHELIGHAATLLDDEIAGLSERLGRAALVADAAGLAELERVYWYTLEFGAVEEAGEVKAFGAGLLSSSGELARFTSEAELLPFDLERMAESDYDPTDYQPRIYVAPSFAALIEEVSAWCAARFPA